MPISFNDIKSRYKDEEPTSDTPPAAREAAKQAPPSRREVVEAVEEYEEPQAPTRAASEEKPKGSPAAPQGHEMVNRYNKPKPTRSSGIRGRLSGIDTVSLKPNKVPFFSAEGTSFCMVTDMRDYESSENASYWVEITFLILHSEAEPCGVKRRWMTDITQKKFRHEIKGCLAALVGIERDDEEAVATLTEARIESMIEDKSIIGNFVAVYSSPGKTLDKDGNTRYYPRFSPIAPEDLPQLEELAKKYSI